MLRRDWLKNVTSWGIGGLGLSLADSLVRVEDVWASTPARPNQWSIVQGATSQDSVQFSILTHKSKVPTVVMRHPTGLRIKPYYSRLESRNYSDWAVLKVRFTGLVLPGQYTLQVSDHGVVDERVVRLQSIGPFASRSARIAVISCFQDTRLKQQQVQYWRHLGSLKPDALFLIGDHVYVDNGFNLSGEAWPERIWRRYCEARLHHELYYLPELIPILSTWDDHDYGMNNGGGNEPWKDEAKAAFCAFFAQDDDGMCSNFAAGPGVATRIDLYGSRYILADDRYWRGLPSRNGPTHWGDEQERWIDQQIDDSPSNAFLMNGSQVFGAYFPGESYEGSHKQSFAAFRERLKNRRKKVVLISGDRHFTELMKISETDVGYATYEFTTSGFIQICPIKIVFPLFKNKRRIAAAAEARNFALIEFKVSSDGELSGTMAARSADGHVIFSRNFRV